MQSGYYYDTDYLNWAQRHGAGDTRWKQLSTGRPAAVGFWFRSSPNLIVLYDEDAVVSTGDPPMISSGMVRVDLDPQGRLMRFQAVPSMGTKATGSPVNWDPLFQAAQLDRAAFTEVAPKTLPRTYADEWKAWTGELPDLPGTSFRIEAAGFRGRPTAFLVAGDWAFGDDRSAGGPASAVRTIGVFDRLRCADRCRAARPPQPAPWTRRPARCVPRLGVRLRSQHRHLDRRARTRERTRRNRSDVRDAGHDALLERRPVRRLPRARALRTTDMACDSDHVVASCLGPAARSTRRPRSPRRDDRRPVRLAHRTGVYSHDDTGGQATTAIGRIAARCRSTAGSRRSR